MTVLGGWTLAALAGIGLLFVACSAGSQEICLINTEQITLTPIRTGVMLAGTGPDYIMSWDKSGNKSINNKIHLAILDSKCNVIDMPDPEEMTDMGRLRTVLSDAVLDTPLGGYLMGMTDGPMPDVIDDTFKNILDPLGLDFSVSDDVGRNPIGGSSNYEDPIALMQFIARRGYPDTATWLISDTSFPPLKRKFTIELDDNKCMTPLPPPYIFDTARVGLTEPEAQEAGFLKLDLTNKFACDATVYAWEYHVDKPGVDVDLVLYTYVNATSTATLVSKLRVTTESQGYNQPTYVFLNPPVTVSKGTLFGVFTTGSGTDDAGIKVAYAYDYDDPTPNTHPYPCSEAAGPHRSSWVLKSTSASSTEVISDPPQVAELAVRPILDPKFKYNAACNVDGDCRGPTLVCTSSRCACEDNYVFIREKNKCIIVDDMTMATAMASGVRGDDVPENALDTDQNSTVWKVGSPGCATTTSQVRPFLVFDTGKIVSLEAISLRTPKPLDPKALANTASDPRALLIGEENELNEHYTGPVQSITTLGPWVWGVFSIAGCDESSDFRILNREMATHGGTFAAAADFGSVNSYPGSICRMVYVGELVIDDGRCLVASGTNLEFANDNCDQFYIGKTALASEYTIRKLLPPNQDTSIALPAMLTGTRPVLGGGSTTTFKFFACPSGSSAQPRSALDEDGPGACIKPAQGDGSMAIVASGPHPALGAGMTCFKLRRTIKADYPTWHYEHANGTFTFSDYTSTQSCMEIEEAGSDPPDGAVVLDLDETSSSYQSLTFSILAGSGYSAATFSSIARVADPGLKYFRVAILDEFFSGMALPPTSTLTLCHSERGAPPPGELTRYACDKAVEGRYVAVFIDDSASHQLSLCDVDIFYSLGKSFGEPCTPATGCDWHRLYCNINGTCDCVDGYVPVALQSGDTICQDFDECRLVADNTCTHPGSVATPGLVDGECRNELGSYSCYCPEGYEHDKSPGGKGCIDIDETQKDNCHCEHNCVNKYMDRDSVPYVCDCLDGYELSEDNHSCPDEDECDGVACNAYAGYCGTNNRFCTEAVSCRNFPGSYECVCPDGYRWSGSGCIDVNECVADSAHPGRIARCEDGCYNKIPHIHDVRYECHCTGLPGTELDPVGKFDCLDINECQRGTDDCGTGSANPFGSDTKTQQGRCKNIYGSFKCECARGFVWNVTGLFCEDQHECEMQMGHTCEHTCINTNGHYECDCHEGYELHNAFYCKNINECRDMPKPCTKPNHQREATDGICVDTIGSYTCKCQSGYRWHEFDGECVDVDECEEEYPCAMECTNKIVEQDGVPYVCGCAAGLKIGEDGRSCLDEDECALGRDHCHDGSSHPPGSPTAVQQGKCHNLYGGYECHCHRGYDWDEQAGNCHEMSVCLGRGGCGKVQMEMCLDDAWDPDLANMDSALAKSTKESVESAMNDLVGERLKPFGVVEMEVGSFYKCSLGVRLVAHTNAAEPSDFTATSIRDAVARALSENGHVLRVLGRDLPVLRLPKLVDHGAGGGGGGGNGGGNSADVCAYYNMKNVCENGGWCEPQGDMPTCRCYAPYTGPTCAKKAHDEHKSDEEEDDEEAEEEGSGLSERDTILVAVGSVLGGGFLLFLVIVMYMFCCRQPNLAKEEWLEENGVYNPNIPSIPTSFAYHTRQPGYRGYYY